MVRLPLDVVDYILNLTGCARWKEDLVCVGLSERYRKFVSKKDRRINVLESAIEDVSGGAYYFKRQYCKGEIDFLKADDRNNSICANLGKLASSFRYNDVVVKESVLCEAEGIVRCFNMRPDLVDVLNMSKFRFLPKTVFVKPSMEVVEKWNGAYLPELFLDNQMALNILLANGVRVITIGDEYRGIPRVITMIVKTKHAVRLLLSRDLFMEYWDVSYSILDREVLLDGLADYPRIIDSSIECDHVEKLYRFIIEQDDKVAKSLMIGIIAKIMHVFSGDDVYKMRSLLRCFYNDEPELANTYYRRDLKTSNGPEDLCDWLEN